MTGVGEAKGWITAEDAVRMRVEKMRSDPAYRAQVEAVEAQRSERVRLLREAEKPIVVELASVGVQVESVWDLVNTSEPYYPALPVLMRHLERGGYPDRVMESLGRAMAVQPAVAYWERLKAIYLSTDESGCREGVAIALSAAATSAQVDDLRDFVEATDLGDTRIYFLRPIKVLGGENDRSFLESLVNDPVLGKRPERSHASGGRGDRAST
jgi:hypothetical protein